MERADTTRLRKERGEFRGKCERRDEWVAKLKNKVGETRGSHERVTEGQAHQILAMEEHLKRVG